MRESVRHARDTLLRVAREAGQEADRDGQFEDTDLKAAAIAYWDSLKRRST